ncbi:uncharacterized protein LOC129410100 [Boleophthalmus pectinirostris]|uniref:uncharacterized protein LOC129410100 n=1 Tax=Boleophthalmus pectinirostris TaxID=150288 RepID=UPI002431FBD3|nr:uncharacterized protein LOC129410100 [Boleophthalmus pectinirostris]
MTCGINLGILLICFLQAVHVCCSWALQDGEGSRREHTNSPVGLSHVRVRGRFEGSRPQDEFRQAFVVKSSSIDSGSNQGLYNQWNTHTASQTNPHKYYHGPQTNPKKYTTDTIYGKVPPTHTLSRSPSFASGSSVSKRDSSNTGVVKTLSGQQEGLHTSQYTYSKPEGHNSKQSLLSQSGSHQPAAWKPHDVANYQKPGLDVSTQLTNLNGNGGLIPPKEYVRATSGLSRGRKVYPNGGSRKKTYPQPQTKLVVSPLHEQYQPPISQQFGLYQSRQGSAYNQSPQLVSLQTGVKLAPVHMSGLELQGERLGPGQRFAPTRIHYIPRMFGGHNIKRLGDEQPLKQTTTHRPLQTTTTQRSKEPLTYPAKMYTFPPRHTESFRPRQPGLLLKSKWMRIRSNQLTGGAGVVGRSF